MGAALTFTAIVAAVASESAAQGLATPQVKLITSVVAHDKRLITLAWSPDGKVLASLGEDRRVKFWDERGGQSMQTELAFSAREIRWSPDSQKIAVVGQRVAVILGRDGKEVARLFGHLGDIASLSWSSDSRRVLTSSDDRTSKLWDAATGKTILTLTPGGPQRKQTKSMLKALFTKDILFDWDSTQASFAGDSRIITASMTPFSKRFPQLWDVTSGQKVATLQPIGSEAVPTFVTLSPDRSIVVTSGFDGAYVWNSVTGRLIRKLELVAGAISFSPDGRRILANSCLHWNSFGCQKQPAMIWDVATGQQTLALDLPTDAFFGLGWSDDGRKVVTSIRHSKASIWDADNGRFIASVMLVKNRSLVADYADDLMLSSRGRVLFAVTDKYVRFWNATTGDLIVEHESLKKGMPLPFSVNPRGHVAAAGDGKTGRVWLWSIVE